MGGGRTRAVYAYRDLDEEVFLPSSDHAYHSQESPLTKPLSESVILRGHFDKTRMRWRQLTLAAGGLLLLGISALLLLIKTVDWQPHQPSPLELAIAAPYGALQRTSGDTKPQRSAPFTDTIGKLSIVEPDGPSVGDADPNDIVATALVNGEDGENDELFYDDDRIAVVDVETEDRPWNGLRGYIDAEEDNESDSMTSTERLAAAAIATDGN